MLALVRTRRLRGNSNACSEFASVIKILVVRGPYRLFFDNAQKASLGCVMVESSIGCMRENFVENRLLHGWQKSLKLARSWGSNFRSI